MKELYKPERVSFAYGQTHAGIQRLHPIIDCEPNSAGSLYKDPEGKTNTFISSTIIYKMVAYCIGEIE